MVERGDLAERFWVWAELNRARIRETLKAARRSIPGVHIVLVEPLIAEMTDELHAYDPRLTPLVALAKDEVLELTITADTKPEAFPSVKALMAHAPSGPAWRFYALRRRRLVEHALLDGGELRGVENIRFDCGLRGGRAFVRLVLPDVCAPLLAQMQSAAAHVVQSLIGEEDFGLHQVGVDTICESDWRGAHPPMPIADLPATFDRMFGLDERRVA